MKIKHFSGYGSVTAKKISRTTTTNFLGEKFVILKIQVSGAHEYGLERNDTYDLYNWLVKRFDKSVASYMDIDKVDIDDNYINGVEVCDYTFTIKQK